MNNASFVNVKTVLKRGMSRRLPMTVVQKLTAVRDTVAGNFKVSDYQRGSCEDTRRGFLRKRSVLSTTRQLSTHTCGVWIGGVVGKKQVNKNCGYRSMCLMDSSLYAPQAHGVNGSLGERVFPRCLNVAKSGSHSLWSSWINFQ